jgi:hypothetical protein
MSWFTKKTAPKTAKVVAVVDCPVWGSQDITNLNQFFGTPTGKKYQDKSLALIQTLAVVGCADVFHTQHSAGVAHGAGELFKCQKSWASNEMAKAISEATTASVAQTESGELEAAGISEHRSF